MTTTTGHRANRDEDFGKAPGVGYHNGVYVRSDLDTHVLLRETELAWILNNPRNLVCKALRAVSEHEESQGDLVSRAAVARPQGLSRHPIPHKRMFLVATDLDHTQDGLRLIDLGWNDETRVMAKVPKSSNKLAEPPASGLVRSRFARNCSRKFAIPLAL